MKFHACELQGVALIELETMGDDRGLFARTYCQDEFRRNGLDADYCQQNMSITARKGTIRGLHFQKHPHAEAKLVRCVRGAVLDVVVDLRCGSPTYLQHRSFPLEAGRWTVLFIPRGFAHGFQTLSDDVEMTYLMSDPYVREAEGGLRFDDPRLAIAWPLAVTEISDRDRLWPPADEGAVIPFGG